MTPDAVELVAHAFTAFNRRDEGALLAACHPEIEWIPMRASLAGRAYHGHEGVREALADIAVEFEELQNDPRRWHDLGESVVVAGRFVAKERDSGLRIDNPAAWLCVLRDRRIVYARAFPSEAAALDAAGERGAGGRD